MAPRLLVTATDAGAARQNGPVAEAARAAGWQVRLAADGVARQVLADQAAESAGPMDAEALVDGWRPDFVLVGLAWPGGGLDDAVLARARRAGIATGVIQDYWGYLGSFPADAFPETVFVLDELAAEITRAQLGAGARCLVTGSPKHQAYAGRMAEFEAAVPPVAGRTALIVGQPMFVPQILDNLALMAEALAAMPEIATVWVKPHPAAADPALYGGQFDRLGGRLTWIDAAAAPEPYLLRADLVMTAFSTAGYDHAYLALHAGRPLGGVLYVTVGDAICAFLAEQCRSDRFPPEVLGLGLRARTAAEILPAAREIVLDPRQGQRYNSAVRKSLGHARHPCQDVLRGIASAIGPRFPSNRV